MIRAPETWQARTGSSRIPKTLKKGIITFFLRNHTWIAIQYFFLSNFYKRPRVRRD